MCLLRICLDMFSNPLLFRELQKIPTNTYVEGLNVITVLNVIKS